MEVSIEISMTKVGRLVGRRDERTWSPAHSSRTCGRQLEKSRKLSEIDEIVNEKRKYCSIVAKVTPLPNIQRRYVHFIGYCFRRQFSLHSSPLSNVRLRDASEAAVMKPGNGGTVPLQYSTRLRVPVGLAAHFNSRLLGQSQLCRVKGEGSCCVVRGWCSNEKMVSCAACG